MRHALFLTLLLIILGCVGVSPVAAQSASKVSLDASWGVARYEAEVDGAEEVAASHFYQQYNLVYSASKTMHNGRAGRYLLQLGYEYTALDPELTVRGVKDDNVVKITTDKLLYNADLIVAPGGLPFRLHAFARDMHQTAFAEGRSSSYGLPVGTQKETGHLISPDIFSDVENGTHKTMGLTLLVGIRNGSYLGAYRDVLSQLPRLLIDYKQEDVKDTERTTSQVHTRNRDLAFVSLNKKDNWVHFRLHDYIDYINPENDTESSQVMIGTIDHVMARQWINLTNWIKISGNGSYTITKQRNDEIPDRTYDLDLFVVARRSGQQLSVLSNYQRDDDGSNVEKRLTVPVLYSADIDRNTRLTTRLLASNRENAVRLNTNVIGDENANSDLYLDQRLELFRQQRTIFKPRLELERITSDTEGNGLGTRLGVEWTSNSQLVKNANWTAGYSLAYLQAQNTAGVSGSYVENQLYGRFAKTLNPAWRVGGDIEARFGSGNATAINGISFRIPTMLSTASHQTYSTSNLVDADYSGQVMQTVATAFGEHRWQRLKNRLAALYDNYRDETESATQTSLEHALRHERDNGYTSLESRIIFGNSGSTGAFDTDYLSAGSSDTQVDLTWKSALKYLYNPNRRLYVTAGAETRGERADSGAQKMYRVTESVSYRFYTANGIVRKLAEVQETITSEYIAQTSNGRTGALIFTLTGALYPTKYFYIKSSGDVVIFRPTGAVQNTLKLETGVNFAKLQVSLAYADAMKQEEDSSFPEVRERRWDIKIKKTF